MMSGKLRSSLNSIITGARKALSTYQICPPYHGPKRSPAEMYELYPVTPLLTVPSHIKCPPYVNAENNPFGVQQGTKIDIKTPAQVDQMRMACAMASYIREFAGKQVRVGITTDEIDKIVHEEIVRINAYPSPLGYHNFPKGICTSVNNVICHGIPDLRPLQNGDILNIDVSIYYDGYHGDCSGMFVAGTTDASALQLIQATEESMYAGINICKPNVPFRAIGAAIQNVAEKYNYGVVPAFAGHGIGTHLHQEPHILHYKNTYPGYMQAGMTFTIEPMLNETVYGNALEHTDKWTMVTVDGARSAQFEQTILITENGPEILTAHKPGYFEKL